VSSTLATIPVAHGPALELVAKGAKQQKVSVPGAKAAYKRAPYAKPSLKFLYAVGWIGGQKSLGQCLLTSRTQDTARKHAEREIRGNPKVLSALRKRGISAGVAAAAIVKGAVSACT
jgi:hypothetical protein